MSDVWRERMGRKIKHGLLEEKGIRIPCIEL